MYLFKVSFHTYLIETFAMAADYYLTMLKLFFFKGTFRIMICPSFV